MADFCDTVRDDIWTILSRKYTTVRQGGHPTDAGEAVRERSFWPDMHFLSVRRHDGPQGAEIRITFTPAKEPGSVYGYKVELDRAAAAWSERVGIRDPRRNPSMFAAELVWYMVAYIGSNRIEACQAGDDGVRWINTGADVFEPLPEPLSQE